MTTSPGAPTAVPSEKAKDLERQILAHNVGDMLAVFSMAIRDAVESVPAQSLIGFHKNGAHKKINNC